MSDFPCEQVITQLSRLLKSWQGTDLHQSDLFTLYQSLLPGFSHWPGDVRIDSAHYPSGLNGVQVHAFVLAHGKDEFVLGLNGTRGWKSLAGEKLGHDTGLLECQFQTQMRLPAFQERAPTASVSRHAAQIQSIIDQETLHELTPLAPSPGKHPRL